MRLVPEIFEAAQSGNLTGNYKPNGRITVLPYWQLKKTNEVYGDSIRGPYRYYTDGSTVDEYEVPAVKSISWNRSKGQDIATCDIEIWNSWHELNTESPELAGQLGKPGYFWPLRGKSADSQATWNQSPGRGAYRRDGTWDASFSWENVLVEDVILKTFEGFGGYPTPGNYVSVDDNLTNGNVVQTGVWIVDTVEGGTDGILKLTCRDIGRILLDQIVFPPLIPGGLYPLEYYTEGKSPFDSYWGPKVRTGVSPASSGEVRLTAYAGSGDGDPSRSSYPLSNSLDGNNNTYALSNAYQQADPDTAGADHVYFEYSVNQKINSISFTPWAGGYECYISVLVGGSWQGSSSVPDGGVSYIKKINVPMYAPDGTEQPLTIELRNVDNQASSAAHYDAQRIRLSFRHLYYSGVPNGSGHQYRAGIRDVIAYRTGSNVSPYSTDLSALPWTFAMDSHPTRGYWVVDDGGTVHGFGDAADYDSTGFGTVPIHSYTNNQAIGMAAHPDGKGYWVIDWRGHVWAYGSASSHGSYALPDPTPASLNSQLKPQALDIAATHTGNGYWVVYSNGIVRGFGDASPSYITFPTTNVSGFMDAFLKSRYQVGRYRPYNISLKSVAVASHPTKMGCWVTDGSGQVRAYGACRSYGELYNRVYNQGMSNSFRLEPLDWASAIESTTTGKGYWIIFASGKIAAFGDAVDQGPVDIYEHLRGSQRNIAVDPQFFDATGFRYLTWGLARDPDGSGFWVLTAAGDVKHYNAEFWGQPGYWGSTGYRWHEGNWDGEFSAIVKELLMWAGFLYYDSGISPSESPSVLGAIESTGIKSDSEITGDKFDKATVLDVIKELAEVVGYILFIDEEGGVHWQSPNWWAAGNYDLSGQKIYVDSGTFDQVSAGDSGAELFVPIVHESVDMFSYSSTLSSADKRSELIIGTERPDPKNPRATQFVRYIPPSARDQVKPGVPSMRNIVRQGIWTSQIFEMQEERQLMAELIGLHAWFAQRTGSLSCVANPGLSLDDQIRVVERNTSETYIHLINSIQSTLDMESGSYQMNITTHWLGDADNWVITTDSGHGDAYSDSPYVSISERVDSWQSLTNRGLNSGDGGYIGDPFEASGEFDSITTSVVSHPTWGASSESYLGTGFGDDNTFVSFMMFGNGVKWPFFDHATPQSYEDGGTTFENTYLKIFEDGKEPILVFGLAPEVFQDAGDAGPSTVDNSDYIDRLIEVLTDYPVSRIIVWQDFEGIGYDIGRYVAFYDEVYSAIKAHNDGILVYGPNVNLADRNAGYDTSYNGVSVDSRDMGLLTGFISGAAALDGLAISGSFSDPDWGNLIEYIKASVSTEQLVVSLRAPTTGPATALNGALDETDIALWPSGTVFEKPYDSDFGHWSFSGTLDVRSRVENVYITPEVVSNVLGNTIGLQVYQGGSLIINKTMNEYDNDVLLGDMGVDGIRTEYTFVVTGVPAGVGTGQLRLRFHASSVGSEVVSDSIVILGG